MPVKKVRLADEVGDEAFRRMVVDVPGRADLQDLARRHHRDAVRHRQRLFLVVGDEDEGDAGLVLQPLQLDLHLLAQLVVERGERLVEQQHLRLRRERARQRHALLLAAGDLAGASVLQLLHVDELQHRVDACLDLGLRLAQHLQAKADVVGHRHVREQRVGLEDGVDRPLERRQRRDVLAVEQDFAVGRIVEAGDQPQQRRLSATGRAEQREEFVFADRDGDIVERPDRSWPVPRKILVTPFASTAGRMAVKIVPSPSWPFTGGSRLANSILAIRDNYD